MEWVILTSEAAFEDIKRAKKWYEEQRTGLSLDYELCLDGGYDVIQDNPEASRLNIEMLGYIIFPGFPMASIIP